MQKDDFSNPSFLLSVDPTGGSGLTWCPAINTLGLAGVSISIRKVSGTITGQFRVQTADFGNDMNHLPAAGDWVDYPNAVAPAASGTVSGTYQIQLWALRSKWIRLAFTDNSSSSPLVDVAITSRGWA